jgi:hypothetical protein
MMPHPSKLRGTQAKAPLGLINTPSLLMSGSPNTFLGNDATSLLAKEHMGKELPWN